MAGISVWVIIWKRLCLKMANGQLKIICKVVASDFKVVKVRAIGQKDHFFFFFSLAAPGLCCIMQDLTSLLTDSSYGVQALWLPGMWDLSSPTRDQTSAPTVQGRFFTTGPPGKYLKRPFQTWIIGSKSWLKIQQERATSKFIKWPCFPQSWSLLVRLTHLQQFPSWELSDRSHIIFEVNLGNRDIIF